VAHDGALLSALLRTFMEHLNAFYRNQARCLGHGDGRPGGVTFVQRFGSSLNLNIHAHVLMLDGVYVTDPDSGQPTFVAVEPPTDDQVQHLVEQAAHRLIAVLQRRGVLDDAQVDAQADQEPVLAAIAAASIQGLVATGERAGRRVRRVLSDPAEGIRTAPLCFASRGFSKRRLAGAAPLHHGPRPRPRRAGTPVPVRQPPAAGLWTPAAAGRGKALLHAENALG